MSQARRATKQTPQQAAPQQGVPYGAPNGYGQPQQSGYPQPYPQQSGYPQPHQPSQYPYAQHQQAPQHHAQPSGYPQPYPQQMQPNYGYGYPPPAYPQQPSYPPPQQPYAQPSYPPAQYAQQPYAQPSYPPPGYPQQQQQQQQQAYPQAQQPDPRDYRVHESGVHPADVEDRTILRPSFGSAPAPREVARGNAAHNDTVVAVSPFADAFSSSRLQAKADSREAETRIQEVDPNLFGSSMNATLTSPPGYPQMSPAQMAATNVPPARQAQASHAAQAVPAARPMTQTPAPAAAAFLPTVAAPAVAPMAAPLAAPAPAPAAPAAYKATEVPAQAKAPAAQPKSNPKERSAKTAKVATPKPKTGATPTNMAMPKLHVHGAGSVDLSKMNKYAGRFGGGMAIVFMLAAVALATAFDVLFLKLPLGSLPFGHYIGRLWYLTTALSFAAAGFGAALMTRGSKGLVITMGVIVAVLYGAADIGLQSVLEGLSFGSALILAGQGVAIALVCGVGAALKGFKQRA